MPIKSEKRNLKGRRIGELENSMPILDLILKNGTIIDGLQTPRYTGDIGIANGQIVQIGRIPDSEAKRVHDCTHLVVCPGFIDLHTHFDSQIFWDPYCTLSGWHGVTSVTIGNCGFGFAPCKPEERERSMLSMERNEAIKASTMAAGMPWDWESFPEFLNSLDRTPKGVNVLSFAGLSPILSYVMGIEAAKSRSATREEMRQMQTILSEAMDAGACGFSTQLSGEDSPQRDYDGTPMVTDLMSDKDLLSFAEVLSWKGRGFMQSIGIDQLLTEKLCEVSGRPMIWNAVSVGTDQHGINHGEYMDCLNWLNSANKRGNRIFGHAFTVPDSFELTFEDWNLFDNEPAWRDVTLGTIDEKIVKMKDPKKRQAIRDTYEVNAKATGAVQGSLENFTVLEGFSAETKPFEADNIGEVARKTGKHPVDAILDLAIADGLRTKFISPPLTRNFDAISDVLNNPFTIPGISDGGAHMKFITMSAFTTEFLTNLVRDAQIMPLEQAHWRLSGYSALAGGITDRGYIREGAPADLVVYDYDALSLGPVERLYDFPAGDWRLSQRADGYKLTIVNGQITFEGNDCTGALPGSLLRHGRAAA